MLTEEELTTAREVIVKAPSGQYKLKKLLYGDLWSNNKPVTIFGKRFRKSVILGHLNSVSLVRQDGDNAWIYSVDK